MKQFIGKVQTRKVDFMDGQVEIKVLTVGDIREIEKLSKKINAKKEEDQDQLEILRYVLRKAVVGAEDLTDSEFDSFPITALSKLSEDIMGTAPGNE